jgi:hypothetical protein
MWCVVTQANLRNAAREWADRMPKVNVAGADSKNTRPRTPVLPGAWRMSKAAGRWPAGAAVAFRYVYQDYASLVRITEASYR